MSIKNPLRRVKQAAADILDTLLPQTGSFAMLRTMAAKKPGMPKTDATSNVNRYIGWVYDAISKNSAEQAATPLRLYAMRGKGQSKAGTRGGIGTPIGRTISKTERARLAKQAIGQNPRFRSAVEIEEIDTHPFLDLIGNSFFDAMLMATYEELTGNSYLAIVPGAAGVPTEVIVMPSQHMKPIVSKGSGIVAYEFGLGSGKIRIPAELVAHNKFPNPHNPYVGLAPLTAAAMAADRDVAMDIYEAALNENMGRPDFAVVLKGENVQRKDLEAYEKQWKAKWGGVARSGNPMFAAGDIDIHNFGFSPREMAFLQGRRITQEQIFGAFGVPVALGKTEGVPRANLEAAILQWTRFTILPRLRMREAVLNTQLMPLYDEPRLFVAYDNPVPEDREEARSERESNLKNYVITVNEARTEQGMATVEWGDVPIVQSTGLPLGSTTLAPVTTPTQRSATGSLGGNIFRRKSAHKAPDDAPDISGGNNPAPTPGERRIMDVTDRMQAKQARDLSAEFDRVAPDAAYDAIKFEPKTYAQLFLDDAVAAMVPEWERGLIVGNIALPEGSRIEVGAFLQQSEAQDVISKQTYRFLESEGETVRKRFAQQMQAGIKAGENVQELRRRLEGMFTDEARNARSLMIARTESARAIELGREASWRESGVVTAKVWDANADSCPFCQAMHGRVVELGANYFEQGAVMEVEFNGAPIHMTLGYSDTPAPPLHPSCRCVLEPQFIDV